MGLKVVTEQKKNGDWQVFMVINDCQFAVDDAFDNYNDADDHAQCVELELENWAFEKYDR